MDKNIIEFAKNNFKNPDMYMSNLGTHFIYGTVGEDRYMISFNQRNAGYVFTRNELYACYSRDPGEILNSVRCLINKDPYEVTDLTKRISTIVNIKTI